MKKIFVIIALAICTTFVSFAQSFNIDAGIALDYSDGYDEIAFGGAVDFDYVFPANVVIFSNTTFTFGSEPKSAISEILGAGYRLNLSEKLYFQAGAGLGIVFFDNGDDSSSYTYNKATMYCDAGSALAVKLAINFTDFIGMNFGVDAIYNPINVWSDQDSSIDPESHLSIIPKVCAVFYF